MFLFIFGENPISPDTPSPQPAEQSHQQNQNNSPAANQPYHYPEFGWPAAESYAIEMRLLREIAHGR
jgi:hypothetical protein